MTVVAAAAVVAPAAAFLPAWGAGTTSTQALCVHLTIDLGNTPIGPNCPPGGPSLITPDGQLDLPPFVVPNEPKPTPSPLWLPIPLPPLD